MPNFSVLIAGCGYVGMALSQLVWRQHGPEAALYGLRRNTTGLPSHVKPVPADLGDPALVHRLPEVDFDYVVICAAPDHSSAEAYAQLYVAHTGNLLAALAQKGVRPRKLLFTSSTAVYAQDHGEVVDEQSSATSTHFRGATMRAAERVVGDSGFASTVLRLGGIYGPGRSHLLRRVADPHFSWPERNTYTNRVHQQDAAAMLLHLMHCTQPMPLVLGVDCLAADHDSIVTYLHTLLGKPLPQLPKRQPGWAGKRCSNVLLRSSGFRCAYPTYKEGFAALTP